MHDTRWIIYCLAGGRLGAYTFAEGFHSLLLRTPVYKLLDAWLTSDNPEIRKLADKIDEEGNNVLIWIRLK